jgi:hypothetical protein
MFGAFSQSGKELVLCDCLEVLDELLDARLELGCSHHAYLEPKLCKVGTQIVLDRDGFACSSLRWVSTIRSSGCAVFSHAPDDKAPLASSAQCRPW